MKLFAPEDMYGFTFTDEHGNRWEQFEYYEDDDDGEVCMLCETYTISGYICVEDRQKPTIVCDDCVIVAGAEVD